jgi:hypothetical protein
MSFRERAEFLRGRVAEQIVATFLQQRGWYIIPSYDYSGEDGNKAPRIQGLYNGFVLPDLDIAKVGHRKWAEVKAKGRPTFTRITQTYDHGIGYRKWNHYRQIQQLTGCHVWLFIIEENSQLLLAESLDVLSVGRRYEGDDMDPGGMMFWPRTAFNCRVALNALPGLFDDHKLLTFEK